MFKYEMRMQLPWMNDRVRRAAEQTMGRALDLIDAADFLESYSAELADTARIMGKETSMEACYIAWYGRIEDGVLAGAGSAG
jgi:hypothetical protein